MEICQSHWGRQPYLPIVKLRGTIDSNYNDLSVAANNSQSELANLRLENQALQLLLKKHLKKNALQNDDDDNTEASPTR